MAWPKPKALRQPSPHNGAAGGCTGRSSPSLAPHGVGGRRHSTAAASPACAPCPPPPRRLAPNPRPSAPPAALVPFGHLHMWVCLAQMHARSASLPPRGATRGALRSLEATGQHPPWRSSSGAPPRQQQQQPQGPQGRLSRPPAASAAAAAGARTAVRVEAAKAALRCSACRGWCSGWSGTWPATAACRWVVVVLQLACIAQGKRAPGGRGRVMTPEAPAEGEGDDQRNSPGGGGGMVA